ncbi:TOMM precursor leader peptide-binding protein [Streptomyces sp. NPDC059629]|uniref:TOMM precursor leader peptide-binding protein n=1 Tax=Streptomyces sp. NPDC059629 TaxID=3346889 RepID=UPI0036742CDF
MTAEITVTPLDTQDGRPPTVVPVGPFGAAVARALRAGPTRFPTADAPPRLHGPVVLSAWRFSRALAREIDTHPDVPWWLPVVSIHPVIQMGPVFGKGLPGCHECLETRLLALEARPEYTTALWDLYDAAPASGPTGFLEHHATVAAGLVEALLAERPGPARSLYTYDVLAGDVVRHTFVPLATCPRWQVRPGQADVRGEA